MSARESVALEHAYLLHQRPFRNSSQLLECFSSDHGRIGLVAHGSRRTPRGARALLQPFVPLRVSWTRRSELGRLLHVEPAGQALALTGNALLSGYYVNELVMTLTARDDVNPEAFSCYVECLHSLRSGQSAARTLRLFELAMLSAVGYGIELRYDVVAREPIDPERRYVVDVESGPRPIQGNRGYLGKNLISLRDGLLDDQESLRAAKRLLGDALRHHLGGRELRSRAVLKDIVQRGLTP